LPKGWSGRWDVHEHIHKVWCVVQHPDVAGAPTAAVVMSIAHAVSPDMEAAEVSGVHGEPATASRCAYDVGSGVRVGSWTCSTPGSFALDVTARYEWFHLLEGV